MKLLQSSSLLVLFAISTQIIAAPFEAPNGAMNPEVDLMLPSEWNSANGFTPDSSFARRTFGRGRPS